MNGKGDMKGVVGYMSMYIAFFIFMAINVLNIKYDFYDLSLLFYSSLLVSLGLSFLSSYLFKNGCVHKVLFFTSSVSIGVMMSSAIAYSFYLLKE